MSFNCASCVLGYIKSDENHFCFIDALCFLFFLTVSVLRVWLGKYSISSTSTVSNGSSKSSESYDTQVAWMRRMELLTFFRELPGRSVREKIGGHAGGRPLLRRAVGGYI